MSKEALPLASKTKTRSTQPPRILVVDDEKSFAHLVEDYFKARGWDVVVALGSLEGFREASRGRFDVITLDINMPEVSGVEAIRAMQLVGQDARMVVVSGYLVDGVAGACRAAGTAAVLAKPVELAHLGDVVEELAGSPRRQGGGNR